MVNPKITKRSKASIFSLVLVSFFAQVNAQSSIKTKFDSLTNQYEKNNFRGVILVAKSDSIIYNKAWGLADNERNIPLRTTTLFKTESTGKMYTATAIMQLFEKGFIKLDQTIRELLPELTIKNADRITVHHLLNHTSGLQSPWDHPEFNFKKDYPRKEIEKIIAELPLVFDEPGKEMYYSNSGYIILQWIIERISGKNFDEYLVTNIFKPLQMAGIRHLNDTVMPVGQAQPYQYLNSKKYLKSTETVGPRASGAGGWIASATDLYHFMLGLDKNKLITPATLKIMRTANATNPTTDSYRQYAYGIEHFFNNIVPGTSVYGHSGGGAGFSIDAIYDPLSHYIIIFCSNTQINPREISSNYLRAALGKGTNPVRFPPPYLVYDKLEEIGIEKFIKGGKEYFQQLDIAPSPRLFIEIAESMQQMKDYDQMEKWLQYGISYYPDNGFIQLLTATALMESGNKEKAALHFNTAKEIAEKNKDQRMLQEIKKRQSLKE